MILPGKHRLLTEDFRRIVFDHEKIELTESGLKEIEDNFSFLKTYSRDKIIYGINTGLGPMAQYKIPDDEQRQLQYNLIRSHCTGSGPFFTEELAKATMLARLNSLLKASSGIHPSTVQLLMDFLNGDITPCIFERGGVGASGDLVQLAHLALNMIGEGELQTSGTWKPAADVFKEKNLAPLHIHLREGLAIMNGTSAMTGVGIVNVIYADKLLNCSIILSSITNEIMKSFDDHFSVELNAAKSHPGQSATATTMRWLLHDSKLIRKRPDHLYHQKSEETIFTDKVQEYYSLRCVPQILGPVLDTLREVKQVLEDEVNSVSDNPVIDHHNKNVYHGGNFHGDYVSLAMDKLKIVITKLCMLSERQLNYLLNDKLNKQLPPFINLGKLGLNFGLQGLQFTATSTTAENQTLSYPMYLHSISNNNDNQDIVSMGCNAALLTRKVIDNSFDVLSIQALAITQAIDYLKCLPQLSSFSRKFYAEVRERSEPFIEDTPRYKDISIMKKYLLQLGSTKLN